MIALSRARYGNVEVEVWSNNPGSPKYLSVTITSYNTETGQKCSAFIRPENLQWVIDTLQQAKIELEGL